MVDVANVTKVIPLLIIMNFHKINHSSITLAKMVTPVYRPIPLKGRIGKSFNEKPALQWHH